MNGNDEDNNFITYDFDSDIDIYINVNMDIKLCWCSHNIGAVTAKKPNRNHNQHIFFYCHSHGDEKLILAD